MNIECENCGGQGVDPNDDGTGTYLCSSCGGSGSVNIPLNKLEEIKKRVAATALNQAEWTEHYRGDVQYLLSVVKTQRESLDKAHVLLDKYENMLCDDGYIICPNCGRVKLDQ